MNEFPAMFLRRICFVVTLAMIAAGLCAAAQSSAPKSAADFSKEAAVIESYKMAYTFQNDGTYTEDLTARIKVQSQAGVQQYGVLVFGYASAIEHMTIDYVRVRQPDGTVVVTPPSGIENITPQVTLAAPEYSDLREQHVAVKGLIPDSEIEYHVHSQISPLVPGQFWLSYDFTKNSIILDEELEVNVPKDRALKLKSTYLQPEVTDQGDRKIYLWKSSCLKDDTPTPHPAGRYPAPDLLLSTFENWAQLGKWWASLADPKEAPSAAIRAKAAELTKGLTTPEQKIQAIYSYVAEQFRYISISFGIGRYEPHAADQVLSNGYGDCKDKTTLLASLLQAAGIAAYPALINSSRKIDPDVPSPAQFDHVITVVPEGQKLQWMDTTSELAPMGLLVFALRDKQALVVPNTQPAYLATTPAGSPVPDSEAFEADGTLAADGTFTGKMKSTTEGDLALLMRLVFNNIAQSNWEKATQGISERMGFGGTVSNVQVSPPEDTSHPFALSYDYVRHDYSNWSQQSPHRFGPPFPPTGVPELPHTDDKTPQPFEMGEPTEIHYSATMKLPEGWTVTVPQPLDLTTPFADYHSSYAFKDGVLTAERRLVTKVDEIPVAQLDDYRKFQKAVSSDLQNQISASGEGGFAGSGGAAATPGSPEFQQDMKEAYDKLRQGDMNGERDAAQHALDTAQRDLKANPNSEVAWRSAGLALEMLGDFSTALADFRKAVALDPKDASAIVGLASALQASGRPDESIPVFRQAIALTPNNAALSWQLAQVLTETGHASEVAGVWRDFIKTSPQNAYAHASLGEALLQEKKYDDAVQEFDTALKLDPKSWGDALGLANSYAEAGRKEEAAAAYEKAAELSPSPGVWNDVGYAMADHDVKLSESETYVKMAVDASENASASVNLSSLQIADLGPTLTLAYYWDSLGWVYFREGDAQKARRFIAASWNLGQDPLVADHLGQIDEKLGQKQQAARDFAWAIALSPGPMRVGKKGQVHTFGPPSRVPDAHDQLMRLVGSNTKFDDAVNSARSQLSAMRTYSIGMAGLKPGTAEFFVLIGPEGKAEGVKFVSGDDSLRAADKAIRAIKFNQPFPDDTPVKILRRGILSCSRLTSTCDFVLLPTGDVHSIN